MKNKLIILIVFLLGFAYETLAISLKLNVGEIFKKENKILNVQILNFTDSIMTCLDVMSGDTLDVKCHTKSITEHLNKNSDRWEGSWPKVGEKVIMVTNFITFERVLFARKTETGNYRFWDPRSIPFANTIFEIPVNSDFEPTQNCELENPIDNKRTCSDGFLCSSNKLNELRNNYNR